MEYTKVIAEFIVATRYEDIPEKVGEIAKDFVLDSVGVQLAGAREPVSLIARECIQEQGGTPEAGVVGGGFKTSLVNAAFLNGTANHAPELEACGNYAGSNPLSVIPVALVLGQKLGSLGRNVLESIVVGFEIQGKLGVATTPGTHNRGWCAIALQGSIGSAVTAAKLLRLDVDKTRMALGIAASQASGLMRQFGTMTHLLEGGFACRNGMTAALLAEKGLTADDRIFDGPSNLWGVMIGADAYDPEMMTNNLGNPFYFVSPGSSLKRFPCCFFTHRAIEALLDLIQSNQLTYEDIQTVEAGVTPFLKNALIGGRSPKDGDLARFSLEHCLACVILDGRITSESFRDDKVQNPLVNQAKGKITLSVHPEWPSGRNALVVPVSVTLKDGKVLKNKVEKLKGTAEAPMTREEQVERYKTLAEPYLSQHQIEETSRDILRLEDLQSISALMHIVTFGPDAVGA